MHCFKLLGLIISDVILVVESNNISNVNDNFNDSESIITKLNE